MSLREEEKCSLSLSPPLPLSLSLSRVIHVTPVQTLSHTLRVRLSRPAIKNVTQIEQ